MPRNKSEENLFHETSMSFGDHLEELRVCLWRSVMGLAIGFVLGLFVAPWVVKAIQEPVERALAVFHEERAMELINDEVQQLTNQGYPADVANFVKQEGVIPETVLVNPDELRMMLGLDPAELPPAIEVSDKADVTDADVEAEADANADPNANTDTNTGTDTEKEGWMAAWKAWAIGAADTDVADTTDVGSKDDKEVDFGAVKITLWRPVESMTRLKSLNQSESFMIYIKGSLVVGLLISSPWVFYQVWAFIAAGLYDREKKYIHIFLPISLTLFFSGAALAYFFVFKFVLNFLFMFNKILDIEPDIRISEWVSFALFLPIGFGISFQLPLVMLFLERIGIFSIKIYWTKWRVSVLVIFIIAMLLTPADPQSMLLMAVPLCFLYFLGIAMCRFMPRRKSSWSELEEAEA